LRYTVLQGFKDIIFGSYKLFQHGDVVILLIFHPDLILFPEIYMIIWYRKVANNMPCLTSQIIHYIYFGIEERNI